MLSRVAHVHWSHSAVSGSECWPQRQCWCETIIIRRQTAPAPWIRHLSAKLINPERGRMASASVLHDRHGEEGIWGLEQWLHLSWRSRRLGQISLKSLLPSFVCLHIMSLFAGVLTFVCVCCFFVSLTLIYPAVSLSLSCTQQQQLQVRPT